MLTFHDLKDKLKLLDEITLMELLEISSEDLIDRFEDYIDAKYETLRREFEEAEEDDEENS